MHDQVFYGLLSGWAKTAGMEDMIAPALLAVNTHLPHRVKAESEVKSSVLSDILARGRETAGNIKENVVKPTWKYLKWPVAGGITMAIPAAAMIYAAARAQADERKRDREELMRMGR